MAFKLISTKSESVQFGSLFICRAGPLGRPSFARCSPIIGHMATKETYLTAVIIGKGTKERFQSAYITRDAGGW